MTRVATLLSRIDDVAGLDLTPAESLAYLQDGHRELCVRAEWLQGTVNFGPTVIGQAGYAYPTNVDHVLWVNVGGVPFEPADEKTVDWINAGVLSVVGFSGSGLYYETTDASGAQSLALYPVPSAAGQAISVKSVLTPPDIVDGSQEPVFPQRFDRYIEAYAKANAFESLEDNPEDAAIYWQRFDQGVADLTALRVGRTGREPWTARVVGVNA